MNPNITRPVAKAHLLELQRLAGCCTAVIEHRRAAMRSAAVRSRHELRRLHLSRSAPACCA